MSDAPFAWRVSLSDIDFDQDERNAVLEVLTSKWLSTGTRTAQFEAQFAARVSAAHAVAVSNGTAALHLALLAVGVGPGDEVIVPSLTFVATANAVLYCGATPVFADVVSEHELVLDPTDVVKKITPRTKALLPMHYGGYPCDMGRFLEIARTHGLRLVDDAAHAPGASWCGRPIGSLGDASCFSFFANKNLVTGEGGMVTTNDPAIAAVLRLNRSHGMTAVSYDKHRGHAFSYDVVSAGYNYRLTELQSALGTAQLAKLDRNNLRRRDLSRLYAGLLCERGELTIPFAQRHEGSACHLMTIVLPEGCDRQRIQDRLRSEGIQTSIHYPPVHKFSNFRERFSAEVPVTERVAGRLMTMPLHPLLHNDDVEFVCDRLSKALDGH